MIRLIILLIDSVISLLSLVSEMVTQYYCECPLVKLYLDNRLNRYLLPVLVGCHVEKKAFYELQKCSIKGVCWYINVSFLFKSSFTETKEKEKFLCSWPKRNSVCLQKNLWRKRFACLFVYLSVN